MRAYLNATGCEVWEGGTSKLISPETGLRQQAHVLRGGSTGCDGLPNTPPLHVLLNAHSGMRGRLPVKGIPMHPHIKPIAALLPLLFVAPAHAQQNLDPVVVTATRQESRVSEVLADVSIIEREDIERHAGGTVVDLLTQQPGVQVSTSGGPGTSASIYLRGARPDQTKILVDGLPINSIDLTGSPLRFLPLANVERIEILRGPASTLYGADAVGGVIQIFTRKGSPGLKADGFIGYGTQNTFQSHAGLSGGDEHWRFRVEGNHDDSKSISAQKNVSQKDADKDAYRNSGGALSASFLPQAGHELGLSYRQNEGRAHYDNFGGNTTNDAYNDFRLKQWRLFSNNRLTDFWSSKLQYGQTSDWQKNYGSWAPKGSAFETESKLLSWQNNFKLPLGKLLLGLEQLDQDASNESGFNSKSIDNQSVFAGWNADFNNHRWQINARHDEHSQFQDKTTYGLAYGYKLSKEWRAHASYGTSFKAPSLYQLYDKFSGNLDLQPEQGKNREVSLIWENATQSVSGTYYLNRVENMIDWSAAANTYQNVSKARLEGLTLSYTGQVQDWLLRATYDWLDASNEDTGFRLGRRAKNKVLLGLDKKWGALQTGAELVGVGARYDSNSGKNPLGGYALVNLNAKYALNKTLSLEGRINNLFDKDYELAKGYNTLGINAFVGIRYTP